MSCVTRLKVFRFAAVCGGVALLSAPALALGQQATASTVTRGYGGGLGALSAPVNASTTSGGVVDFVNGVLVAPQGSIFANISIPQPSGGSTTAAPSAARSILGSRPLDVAPAAGAPAPTARTAPDVAPAADAPIVLNGKVNLDGVQS